MSTDVRIERATADHRIASTAQLRTELGREHALRAIAECRQQIQPKEGNQ